MSNENLKDWEAVYKAVRIKKNTAIMDGSNGCHEEATKVLEKINKLQQDDVPPVPLEYRHLIEEGNNILHATVQKSNEDVEKWRKEKEKNREINRRIAERKHAEEEKKIQEKYAVGEEVFVTLKWINNDYSLFIDDLPVQILIDGTTDDRLHELYNNLLEGDKVKVKLIGIGFEPGIFDRKIYAFKAYIVEIITQSLPG